MEKIRPYNEAENDFQKLLNIYSDQLKSYDFSGSTPLLLEFLEKNNKIDLEKEISFVIDIDLGNEVLDHQNKIIDFLISNMDHSMKLVMGIFDLMPPFNVNKDSDFASAFFNRQLMKRALSAIADKQKTINATMVINNPVAGVSIAINEVLGSHTGEGGSKKDGTEAALSQSEIDSHKALLKMAKDKDKSGEQCFKARIDSLDDELVNFHRFPDSVIKSIIGLEIVGYPVWGGGSKFYFGGMNFDYIIKLLMEKGEIKSAKWLHENIKRPPCIGILVENCTFLEAIPDDNSDAYYDLTDDDKKKLS